MPRGMKSPGGGFSDEACGASPETIGAFARSFCKLLKIGKQITFMHLPNHCRQHRDLEACGLPVVRFRAGSKEPEDCVWYQLLGPQ